MNPLVLRSRCLAKETKVAKDPIPLDSSLRFLRHLREIFFSGALLGASSLRAEVQIERTFLPDAAPSSFAIGLPGGVSFCFDPVRGSVSYAWTGDFLDVTPARPGPGKFIKPAKPLGRMVYRETGVAPLRRGDPTRTPAVEFAGYTMRDDSVEFRYLVDGALVREEIKVKADRSALVRRFQIEGGADAKWWLVSEGQPPVELRREGGAFVQEIPLGKAAP